VTYLFTRWQPIVVLTMGIVILTLYYYLQLNKKKHIIPWMAKYIFRNQFLSEKSAESLFNVITSFLFTIGGIWAIVGIYFLSKG
jgi:hypothetical protein